MSSNYIIGGNCHKYNFCRDKHLFVATKHVFCSDKFCRGKHAFVLTSFCLDKLLSRQTFVATKMVLVAAPAKDINITYKLGKIAKSVRPVFVLFDL